MKQNPQYRDEFHFIQSQIKSRLSRQSTYRGTAVVYTIPVVVHVIHLGEAVGTGSNISDSQIAGAITGLNNRYRNLIGNSLDIGIEFCLALRDPNGNASNGIIRVNGSSVPLYSAEGIQVDANGGADEMSIKNLSRWPNTEYYNIWVVHSIYGGTVAYAYFPTTSNADGTVIEAAYMTSNSTTLTHELGHAFDLFHTFEGDNDGVNCPLDSDCSIDGDEICDTPPHKRGDCGTSNPCTTSGVWNNSRYNYMNYCSTKDRFTSNQKERMIAAVNSFPRSELLNSLGCVRVACPNGEACNDNNLCTTDQCAGGLCMYNPLDCHDGDICTDDECTSGTCVHSSGNRSLTTTFNSNTNLRGNMFDVTAVNSVTVLSFDGNFGSTSNFAIYFRAGTHVGFEQSSASWTLIGTATNVASNGNGVPSPIPIPVGITIPAGQTYAFYITTTNGLNINYAYGTAVGNVSAQDANLIIREGTANNYPFGSIFQPRKWNGTLYYVPSGCIGDCIGCEDGIVCTADNCDNGQCVYPDTCCTTQSISLITGWNMISSYVIPDAPNMTNVFQEIVSKIILVKNNAGLSYIPSLNINSIGNWDYKQGYKVKTNSTATLQLGCTKANPSSPISLSTGWNMISYLRPSPISISAALSSVSGSIIMVKNNAGQSYIPSLGVNTIVNMQPGQGYQIKMSAPATLVFPP